MDIKPPKAWRTQHTPKTDPVESPVNSAPQTPVRLVAPTKPASEPRPEPLPSQNQPEKKSETSENTTKTEPTEKKPRKKIPRLLIILLAIFLVIGSLLATALWLIGPLNNDSSVRAFVVKSGESPSVIGSNLEQQKFIRSQLVFSSYVRLTGVGDKLRAGTYRLSSDQSLKQIVDHLLKGNDEVYNVTIPPGLTLKQLADPEVKNSFAAQGFSESEIQEAFTATYQSPLLKDKPAGASLEGYIFPETFQIRSTDGLSAVLERSFEELYSRIQRDGLEEKIAARGLSLHQAVTLASIIQEETSVPSVQAQVGQVFLKRLEIGMPLGADVTFVYAAHQLDVAPVPNLDSPYNTRLHTGLPPGPIANFNYSALEAVAKPSEGDYLYFVAGDDGKVHFGRTFEEHQSYIDQYCQRCAEPIPPL